MTAPRDSQCRYKECYNCRHRQRMAVSSAPNYACALALDGSIRVFECGGLHYYRPATKSQRKEQHSRLGG
jgi:hypothetical protein